MEITKALTGVESCRDLARLKVAVNFAQDLTQSFFARLLEKNYVAQADRERGRFRTYLLAALTHFLNFGLAYTPANNLAVGGSLTDVVLSQAASFNPPAEPEWCLYHFWAGYTDFRRTSDNLASDIVWNNRIGSWVGNISNAVVRLDGKGARSIVVPNVFDRSREPWAITAFGANSANQLLLPAQEPMSGLLL